jgi:hypothetical protein
MHAAVEDDDDVSPFGAWSAQDYLHDYYTHIQEDEVLTLRFLVRELRRRAPRARRALAFGVGPTVHHLLALSRSAEHIDAADLLDDNLREVQRWLHGGSDAHDWSPFTRHVLACEGARRIDEGTVRARETLTRRRVVRLLSGDAARAPALAVSPIGVAHARRSSAPTTGYDIVLSCYCADSATGDKATWAHYMDNILALLRRPQGLFLMAALRRCRSYTVGPRRFPGADIDEHDVSRVLHRHGFSARGCTVEARQLAAGSLHGYEGIVLAAAGPHGRADVPSQQVARGPFPRRGLFRCSNAS